MTATNQDHAGRPDDLSFGLGDRMKKARRAFRPRVTGQQVADDLGVERQTISNYENGHTKRPLGFVVRYYANRFGVSEAYLRGEEEAGPGQQGDASRCIRADRISRRPLVSVADVA